MGRELIDKHDNAAALRSRMEEFSKAVTEVQSTSLEQQLAREKKYASAPAAGGSTTFAVGDRVSHRMFGEGTVLSVTPAANDAMLEIAFEKVGTKKIMANFAKIQKL